MSKEPSSVRRIVLEASDESPWTATFVGKGPYTVVDIRDAQRALTLGHRQYVHHLRVAAVTRAMKESGDGEG